MRRKIAFALLLSFVFYSVFLTAKIAKADENVVCVVFFTQSGCKPCDRVSPLVLNDLPRQYSGRFLVVEYELPDHEDILRGYASTYNCSVRWPLIIFKVNDFLDGADAIYYNLTNKIEEYLGFGGNKLPLIDGSSMVFEDIKAENLPGSPKPEIWFVDPNAPSQIPAFLMIVSAAAVDSVNPCEFAILVILLSSVTASEGRKKALKTGLAFVFAVFIMYLLIGVGILQITTTFAFLGIPFYFRKIVGIFALIVGALNIKDYFWEDAKGVLSSMPISWRPKVQKLLDNVTSASGAFLSGVFVSFFLLPCTSGPYFVVLSLLDFESTRLLATALLLLYNLIFILPMIGIVLAVYFGLTTTAKAAHWRHKRVGLLHLIAGALMLCMGIWMLFFY